jgi:hypothetical protein
VCLPARRKQGDTASSLIYTIYPNMTLTAAESPDYKPRINWSRFHETMPLEEAARTGGRVTVEDLQRSASMPIEEAEDGRGQTMGALGARAPARKGNIGKNMLPAWSIGGWCGERSRRVRIVMSLRPGAGRRLARVPRCVRLGSGVVPVKCGGLGVRCCAERAARRAPGVTGGVNICPYFSAPHAATVSRQAPHALLSRAPTAADRA